MNIKKYWIFLIISFVPMPDNYSYDDAYTFSLDYLYPEKNYFHAIALAKELWSDLDAMLTEPSDIDCNILVSAAHIPERIGQLKVIVSELMQDQEHHFVEDIAYLAMIITTIQEKITLLLEKNNTVDLQNACNTLDIIQKILNLFMIIHKEHIV